MIFQHNPRYVGSYMDAATWHQRIHDHIVAAHRARGTWL